jgi:glycosyltransferase involved in cell wall biosynthesis
LEIDTNKSSNNREWKVIYNSFNASFVSSCLPDINLFSQNNLNKGYILHVGSNLHRKNRKLLLDLVLSLGNRWKGCICYAGQLLENDLLEYAKQVDLLDRIVSIVNPDHETLVALYNSCEAFIFPSFSEGFGWPLIEAQACGAPVIASNIEPMLEVTGGAALFANPFDAEDFANVFIDLMSDLSLREKLIQEGFDNCKRFNSDKMINSYLKLHGLPTIK